MKDRIKFFEVLPASLLLVLAAIGLSFSQEFQREAYNDPFNIANCDVDGWEMIFDGTDETAVNNLWISNASHGDGGNWWIDVDPETEDRGTIPAGQRVLWSNQNPGGSGGLMYTHRTMANCEVELEFFPGWRNDGGLFLRSNGRGGAYQVMLDYQPGNTIGGIYPEGISAQSQKNYNLEAEDRITAQGIDWPAEDWPDIWDADGYNKIYGKIWGETRVEAYIHDPVHWVTNYNVGSNAPQLNETGYVGFQIHAGEGAWPGGPNRYKYIRVREIDDNEQPVCIGTRQSACNIAGYTEYDPATASGAVIGDPSKCLEIGVGVKAEEAKDIHNLSARSSGGELSISGSLEKDYELVLITAAGKIVSRQNGIAGSVHHTFAAPEGVYFLHVISDGNTSIQKILSF